MIKNEADCQSELQASTRLYEDLGISSFGLVSLVVKMEEEIGIEVDFADLKDVKTVGDLMLAIQRYGQEV